MKRVPLILAALLQVLPLARVAVVSQASASAPSFAVVFTWLAAAALLGGHDAVSGASASVAGVVKYVGTSPVGSPTNYVMEPVGEVFKYRITVSNPGVDFEMNYFNCVPLPPGLTINTNPGAAGYITGTPTLAGTYPVTLVAGNLNYPTPSTLPATLVLYPVNAPPLITSQPQAQSVQAGGNVTFAVGAQGSLALSYQWFRGATSLSGRTAPSLSLTNVGSSQAGDYRVIITNLFGSATSAVARLIVREASLLDLKLGQAAVANDACRFVVTGPIYTNYVIWRSPDLRVWTPIRTNFVLDGYLEVTDPAPAAGPGNYYRASTQ